MNKIYYNRIKSVLQEKGIANRQLAREMGVSEKTVYRWRNNITQPSLESLFKIARYLDTDVRYLLESTPWINANGSGSDYS